MLNFAPIIFTAPDSSSLQTNSLLLDESQLDDTGKTCAKIGVSKDTIINQKDRCEKHIHCLANQVDDIKEYTRLSVMLPHSDIRGSDEEVELTRSGIAASSLQLCLPVKGKSIVCCFCCAFASYLASLSSMMLI